MNLELVAIVVAEYDPAIDFNDFQSEYERLAAAGVEFVTQPWTEPYGRVAVFFDVAGNRWDLLGSS